VFGVILGLYALKAALFRRAISPFRTLVYFLAAVALAVPVIWLFCPAWNTFNSAPIAHWVGTPIMVLTVPCISFLFDYANGRRSKGRWSIRLPLEIFVGVPVWASIWVWIMLLALEWIWI
jgi:hypothetical protein